MSDYLISILLGYFIGSFPTAYLLVKTKTKKDIRQEGTGIVGTFNTFEITQSIILGITVLTIDILKGVFAVLTVKVLLNSEFWLLASSGISAIIGHNFPVWLKFKSGRGLAVTAGVMFILGWIFIVIWILSYAVVYLISKNLYYGNIGATVVSPLILAFIPERVFIISIPFINQTDFIYLVIIVCTLLLIGHSDVIKSLYQKKETKYIKNAIPVLLIYLITYLSVY